eukprot:gene12915-biopygen4890
MHPLCPLYAQCDQVNYMPNGPLDLPATPVPHTQVHGTWTLPGPAPWTRPADRAPAPSYPNAAVRLVPSKGHATQAAAGDRPALEALYLATGGEQWGIKDNWMGPGSVCGWDGVSECIEGTQQVSLLDRVTNQLSGTLPEAMGQMTALTTLNLSGNPLSGTLPEALGLMTALKSLYLSGNQLSGFITEHLFLHEYSYLYLQGNDWTCPLPENPWNDKPSVTCTDPDPSAPLSQLYDFTEGSHWLRSDLWDSNASACSWQGVGCGDHSVVSRLDLAANNLTGQLPDTIWAAPDLAVGLTALLLAGNSLTGSLPATVALMPVLQVLDLSSNELSSLPPSLSDATTLVSINVASNRLSGSLPEFCQLADISDPSPYRLAEIDLSSNQLEGDIPSSLYGCHSLSVLDLSGNRLSGPLDLGLGKLCHLSQLDVSSNLLDSVGNLSGNTSVYCPQGTDLSEPTFPSATTIDLSHNSIAGPFPTSLLLSATRLQFLDLSDNKFTGPLPRLADSTARSSLLVTRLSNNAFEGNPSDIGEFPAESGLLTVDLRGNLLGSGLAPWATPATLELLLLDGNPFVGNMSAFLRSYNIAPSDPDAPASVSTKPR